MQLLERAPQLEALDLALSEVQAGEGRVALVYGEAGIGKTSLVDEFVKRRAAAWRILTGACDLLFTPRPLGPVGDIALQTQGRLLSLLDSGGGRSALFSACLAELTGKPSIVVIEDIHWADEATLDLLKYLSRRIRQTTCLMVLTYRDDEIGSDHALQSLLGDLASSPRVHRVPVPALSVDGVQELAKNKDFDVVALHHLTNGNPFFVTEILAGPAAQGIPQTVRDAVLARAARVSAPGRSLLEAAAVIGRFVEPWLLSKIADGEASRVEECVSMGMLQARGDGYAFRHELVRQTILESIEPQRRIRLNRMALTALQDSPETCTDLARLASHAAGTNDGPTVLKYAPAAAQQAVAAGAHQQAAALYELALRFSLALPVDHQAQLLEAYADEQRFLSRPQTLIPVRRKIIEKYRSLGDRLREASHLALLAADLHNAMYSSEAQHAIRAAVPMLERLAPSVELARAYRVQSFLLLQNGDFVKGVAAAEKSIALAEQFEDPETLARACNLAGEALLYMDDERSRGFMERSLAVARQYRLDFEVGLALCNWGWALVETFRFEEASRLLQEGIAFTRRHDDDYHGAAMQDLEAQIQMYRGHWREASDLIRHARGRPNMSVIQRSYCAQILGRLSVRRGDAGAQQALDEALALCTQTNSLYYVSAVRAAQAAAAWLRGDDQQAIQQSRAAYDPAVRQHFPWWAGELAFWRWRAGDVFTPPEWIAKPYALQIAGDWRGAAREWEQRGCPYEQAMALMDGDEAAQLAALEIFERLGARPILAKLKRKLREEGVRIIPRGPRESTRENRFGLTSREMEILSCVLKGQSNRSIAQELSLSKRTVEHHIASMLQKTDTLSREELAALALNEGLIPAG